MGVKAAVRRRMTTLGGDTVTAGVIVSTGGSANDWQPAANMPRLAIRDNKRKKLARVVLCMAEEDWDGEINEGLFQVLIKVCDGARHCQAKGIGQVVIVSGI